MHRPMITILSVLLLGLLGTARAFEVFQDPTNQGENPGIPASVEAGTTVELNLFVRQDGVLSEDGSACTGTGSGDEFCGWAIQIEAQGGVELVAFSEDEDGPAESMASRLTPPGLLRVSRVEPTGGVVGAQRIGTLSVHATSLGTVEVTGDRFVDASLQLAPVPAALIAVGHMCAGLGGDLDADGICADGDGSSVSGDNPCTGGNTVGCDDNCPFRSNPDQLDRGRLNSTDPDGIGDLCQCGDINADGRVTQTDAILIKRTALGLSPYFTPEGMPEPGNCDVNDGVGDSCNNTDATITKRALIDKLPGILSLCANAQLPAP